jgi:hypothetical protein
MTYLQLMNVLTSFRQVRISMLDITDFVIFCKGHGVNPRGGNIESDGSQWLYI